MKYGHSLSAAVAICCLLTSFASSIHAADALAAQSPQARRDELAKVQEMLSDPDPLMRQANMEAIVKSKDAARIRLAMRIAFVSDDKDIRATAMRAYMGSVKELIFDVTMPDQLQKAYDSVKGDPEKLEELERRFGFIRDLHAGHFSVDLKVDDYDANENAGKFSQATRKDQTGAFTVVGETAKGQTNYVFRGSQEMCQIIFKPTREMTLVGTLGCSLSQAPMFSISATMF